MADQKTKQLMRFTDKELQTIKSAFSENDELLMVIRKIFLQMPLNALELSMSETFIKSKSDVLAVIRKSFLPTIDPNAPLGQIVDLWMNVPIEDKNPETAKPHIEIRKRFIEYIEQQLDYLEGKGKEVIYFRDFERLEISDFEDYVRLYTRKTILSHIEQRLLELLILAGSKEETQEETLKRLKKNSAK